MRIANNDAKGLGNTINILSKEGKINPVTILFSDGSKVECNSTWAATDYLKENDFYKGTLGVDKLDYKII